MSVAPTNLEYEDLLEDAIESTPEFLGLQLLIIGRQWTTECGGKVDLLAVDAECRIHVIELKREKTATYFLAQIPRYVAATEGMSVGDLVRAYAKHHDGETLEKAFLAYFGTQLPTTIPQSPLLTVVATSLPAPILTVVKSMVRNHNYSIDVVLFRHLRIGGKSVFIRLLQTEPGIAAEPSAPQQPPIALDPTPERGEDTRLISTIEALSRTQIEQSRLHVSIESRLEDLSARINAVAATTNSIKKRPRQPRPIEPDAQILAFTASYFPRLVWHFVPFSFVYALYEHWVHHEGKGRSPTVPIPPKRFSRLLPLAVAAHDGWKPHQCRPLHLISEPEPLTELVPGWRLDKPGEPTRGLLRIGAAK
ncbi:hypothetical protein [Microbacterium murale]|uniref:DUF91 domain-containing protein n=1 Tax=Microbacterium murale TaxID=1081040 RepID=A0ABQ1RT97_9MICO|nr:hypothetical protein [Microbacterium murale]GGD76619.1 hypothetical protein GCM10007269_19460 [Microbacterium murale]